MILTYALTLLASISAVRPAALAPTCKPQPSQQGWPSDAKWQALNSTVSGRLMTPVPPGAVCHPNQPTYNNATCATVYQQWSNSSFHAMNAWSTDYNDDACLPSSKVPCTTALLPAYAIEAVSAADVQAGVKFAADTGVRLIVKATGHDYPGRSQGPGSLEIWTHMLRGVNVTMGDPKAITTGAIGSMTIAAGMRWEEIYMEAIKNNVTAVGGASTDVGIGGWTLNGGHSPISGLYGLGADQVLEMEVVTADGQLRTLNPDSNSDLFWAMRGGGGSTFAVMTSITVKAYSQIAGSAYFYAYNTTTETYWDLLTYFHTQLANLSDNGGMGYYYSTLQSGNPDPKRQAIVYGVFIFPYLTGAQSSYLMAAIEKPMNTSSWSKDPVYKTSKSVEYADFLTAWLASETPEAVGNDGRLGSWLLDKAALTGDFDNMKAVLKTASPPTGYVGHLVAGRGVANALVAGGSNAVLPAWRKAYVHLVVPVSWTPYNESEKATAIQWLRNVSVPALKSLAPDSGAYVNEADPAQPDWQQAFYGDNYDRLLSIKKQYDPNGVFWCKPCVGNELWTVVDGPSDEAQVEWGIGQSPGMICKASTT